MTWWKDRTRKYSTAAETAKPGYLKRRFAQIRKEQREQEQAALANVQPIKQKAKGGK